MLPMIPRTPSTLSNSRCGNIMLWGGGGGSAKETEQLHRIKGMMDRARALKMGRGWVFQHIMTQNTQPRQQRSGSR